MMGVKTPMPPVKPKVMLFHSAPTILSLSVLRRQSMLALTLFLSSGQPRFLASTRLLLRASSLLTTPQGARALADCMMAWLKRFLERGDNRWRLTLQAPADSPIRVMLLGFPPNLAMLFFTHLIASSWSYIPALPGTSSSGK